jgi:putative NADH-flavin reductase
MGHRHGVGQPRGAGLPQPRLRPGLTKLAGRAVVAPDGDAYAVRGRRNAAGMKGNTTVRIAVLGGRGRTGQLLVAELRRRGHELTVLARTPEKLGATEGAVRVVTGASTDADALASLLEGAGAVVCALGPTSRDSTVMSDTARVLMPVMEQRGIRRFVGVSGTGVDMEGDLKGRKDRVISSMIRRVGGVMATDKAEEYRILLASDLDWTLARPPRLVDGPAAGRVVHDARTPGRSSSIRRADLAVFLADAVEQDLYVRQSPFVSAG